MKKLLAVTLFTCIAACGQTVPKRLITKQHISPLVARLTYLWAQEILDAADNSNSETFEQDDARITAIRKQIDQSIQFDFRTVGDLILLHMIDEGAFRMEGLMLHKLGHSTGYDPTINPYTCLDRVQEAARTHSIAMIDSKVCKKQ